MNRAKFFDAIRPMFPKGLTQTQVDVINGILDGMAGHSVAHVGYILATAYGEANLTPTRENMNYSAARIKQVWPSRPEAVRYAGKPKALANEVYGGRLGNRPGTDDGWRFRGGGVDQLTGRANYAKIGLEHNPERILHPDQAVKSIIHGMTTGRYTGRKLSDYDRPNGFDFVAARAIVNGDVALNGRKYGGNAVLFRNALQSAGWGSVSPKPVADSLKPAPVTKQEVVTGRAGFWAWLINLFMGFRK